MSSIIPILPSEYQTEFRSLADQLVSFDLAKRAEKILQHVYQQHCKQNSSQRLLSWKKRMRSNENEAAKWLRTKNKKNTLAISMTKNGPSANSQSRMEAIRDAWSKTFWAHKNGEPNLRQFMDKFGPSLKRATVELPPLQPDDLIQQVLKNKTSTPGLDKWTYQELQTLARWCPSMFHYLTELLQGIENGLSWPDPLKIGMVSFTPKEVDGDYPTPLQHRPITVLSTIYRLWSSVRHSQLADMWLPQWIPDGIYGAKNTPAADVLTHHTCQDIEKAIRETYLPGGLSYDFEKTFDRVPFQLAINILRARGCDEKICRTLNNFYNGHNKLFKIDGHYDQPFIPTNGIIQRCPLSMLILTSLTACWHETITQNERLRPRSYADDLSSIDAQPNEQLLKDSIKKMHEHTQKFAQASGLKINAGKTFTFGHSCLEKLLPSIPNHKDGFRLTGAVVKISQKKCWTELEQQRASKWSQTTQAVRNLPVGWFAKVKVLQQRTTQLSWGHGTHKLALTKPEIRSLRADVARCLLNTDDYCASPLAIFTILAPPSLDPEFCLHSSAIRLLQRALKTSEDPQAFKQLVDATLPKHDGPAARASQLLQHEAFSEAVQSVLQNKPFSPQDPHELRQSWRKYVWKNLARDRPQHFAGAQFGIRKDLSISLLKLWAADADRLQDDIDNARCAPPDLSEDPRPRMKILRLLLVGALRLTIAIDGKKAPLNALVVEIPLTTTSLGNARYSKICVHQH